MVEKFIYEAYLVAWINFLGKTLLPINPITKHTFHK